MWNNLTSGISSHLQLKEAVGTILSAIEKFNCIPFTWTAYIGSI